MKRISRDKKFYWTFVQHCSPERGERDPKCDNQSCRMSPIPQIYISYLSVFSVLIIWHSATLWQLCTKIIQFEVIFNLLYTTTVSMFLFFEILSMSFWKMRKAMSYVHQCNGACLSVLNFHFFSVCQNPQLYDHHYRISQKYEMNLVRESFGEASVGRNSTPSNNIAPPFWVAWLWQPSVVTIYNYRFFQNRHPPPSYLASKFRVGPLLSVTLVRLLSPSAPAAHKYAPPLPCPKLGSQADAQICDTIKTVFTF